MAAAEASPPERHAWRRPPRRPSRRPPWRRWKSSLADRWSSPPRRLAAAVGAAHGRRSRPKPLSPPLSQGLLLPATPAVSSPHQRPHTTGVSPPEDGTTTNLVDWMGRGWVAERARRRRAPATRRARPIRRHLRPLLRPRGGGRPASVGMRGVVLATGAPRCHRVVFNGASRRTIQTKRYVRTSWPISRWARLEKGDSGTGRSSPSDKHHGFHGDLRCGVGLDEYQPLPLRGGGRGSAPTALREATGKPRPSQLTLLVPPRTLTRVEAAAVRRPRVRRAVCFRGRGRDRARSRDGRWDLSTTGRRSWRCAHDGRHSRRRPV